MRLILRAAWGLTWAPFRRPRPTWALIGACLAVVLTGILESSSRPELAPDTALRGTAFGIALPLLSYFMVEATLAGHTWDGALTLFARHGADRRAVVSVLFLSSAGGLIGVGSLLGGLSVISGYQTFETLFWNDLAASLWIGALGGAAYAAWYLMASTFGRRGSVRKWALLVDFVLGSQTGSLALPCPRGHLRSLLGGLPVLELSQSQSALALLLGIGVCLLIALARVSP